MRDRGCSARAGPRRPRPQARRRRDGTGRAPARRPCAHPASPFRPARAGRGRRRRAARRRGARARGHRRRRPAALGPRRVPARLRRRVHDDGGPAPDRRPVRLPPRARLAPPARLPVPRAALAGDDQRVLAATAVGSRAPSRHSRCSRGGCAHRMGRRARDRAPRRRAAFQVLHGREVRMYPELELIGVGAAVLADSWLRQPRRWHAPLVGALTLVCLLTHVSGFLLGAGFLALAGRRTDREAWRWRAALAAARRGLGRAVGSVVPGPDARRTLRLDPAHHRLEHGARLRQARHRDLESPTRRAGRGRGRRRAARPGRPPPRPRLDLLRAGAVWPRGAVRRVRAPCSSTAR